MSLLTKPEELTGETLFLGLIYGQPGIGKTTLALSSPNPVCLDFDKGMKRVQPQYRVPSLQVDSYQQVIDLLNSPEMVGFDTIIIDTLGKLVDKIGEHVAIKNPKLKQADGTLTMKGWGAIKPVFQSFLSQLRAKRKSILFVAHESEEKNGDEVKMRPDCSGSARKDIVKELDFMGYMEMIGNERTISFSPTEKFYAKNSLGLGDHIKLPDITQGNNFVAKYIVSLSESKLKEQAEMRGQYESLIGLIEGNIKDLKTAADLNTYYGSMASKAVIWDSAFYEKRQLAERAKSLGMIFDKETRQFKQGNANASGNQIAA